MNKQEQLDIVRQMIADGVVTQEQAAKYFPELAKSDDEKIRKALLEMVHDTTGDELWIGYDVHKEEALAWLEKQGEQNIAEISNVCEYSIETWVKIVDYVLTEHNGIGNYLIDPEVKDTAEKLQNKYKFDAASEEWDRVYRKGLDAGVNKGRAEALREQKPAWGEEDIAAVSRVISIVKWAAYSDHSHPILNDKGATELVERLKSLKDRVQPQPKQEWSEEDEKMIENIIDIINMSIEDCDVDDIETKARFTLEKERDWLKSLKERYDWKPSELQIEALVSAIDVMIDNRGAGDKNTILLSGLYHELKTL